MGMNIRFPLALSCRLILGSAYGSPLIHVRRMLWTRDIKNVVSLSGYSPRKQKDYLRSWQPQSVHCLACSSLARQYICHQSAFSALGKVNNYYELAYHWQSVTGRANYATTPDSKKPEVEAATSEKQETGAEVTEEKLSIFQRFKRAYKEHGKVLVGVHVATSIVWYGSFYAAARCGLDLVPWMEQWGFSETLIKPFRSGGLGDFALAYLMYKLATPARYTVTLGGTNIVIRHLRSRGKMAPKSAEDSIRQLYKDGREQIRVKRSSLKDSSLRKERLRRLRVAKEKRKEKKWREGKHH